jgi:alpha-glucuronidase
MSTEIQPLKKSGIWWVVAAVVGALFSAMALPAPVHAETGYDAWLRYPAIDDKGVKERYAGLPAVVVRLGDSEQIDSASNELVRGVRSMLGRTLRIESKMPKEGAILLGTFDAVKKVAPSIEKMPQLAEDGFWLRTIQLEGQTYLLIAAPNDRGVLYGVFAVLKKIALSQPIAELNEQHAPAAPLRMLNHRDGLDGTLDRGFAGESIFWNDGSIDSDMDWVHDYARLLASIGINGITINSPAAGPRVMTPAKLEQLSRIADTIRPWGIRLFIAINSVTPPASGDGERARNDSEDADPWVELVDLAYSTIPDLGGLVLEADWGPFDSAAERAPTHAQAINRIAAALKKHNGILFCRTCRCNIAIDRADPKHDPAKAAYATFQALDGLLDDNVVLQVKQGPMDFQVREPASPLFAALTKTNQVAELEATQHFLGQQRHLCFLVPMWKEVLDFDLQVKDAATPVKELAAGKTFARPTGGFVALVNVSRAKNWLGYDLAVANLYGFGRLAWDPNLSSKAIAEEWTRLTFGHDPLVVGALVDMLLKSWRIYESYTGPLGAGSLTDLGDVQYGPGIESADPRTWSAWHNADEKGIGKDRTIASGTGFVAQYPKPVADRFEALNTCPESLLLFMHHVPYTHMLSSGKTVIQHIYDAHYQGARDAARLVQQWRSLKGHIDDQRYEAVLTRLQYQAGHAKVWRDAVCTWFLHKSGIADNEGRVGNYPNRFEAESLTLEGFEPQNVTPWETASGGQCAQCIEPSGKGALSMNYDGKPGWFQVSVSYFDEHDGASSFQLLVADQVVADWKADDSLPDSKPNGHTSTRYQSGPIALRPGDTIRVEAIADSGERAAVDYLEIDAAQN